MDSYTPASKSKKRKRLTSYTEQVSLPSWRNLLAVVGILSNSVFAQKSSATCTSAWNWLSNKENESPCTVAAQLLALCDTKPSSFDLGSGKVYIPGGSSSLTPNTCSCNIVTYNLLMACQACQKGASPSDIPSWSQFGQECSICSTETGISPGPCGQQPNAGFPNSVHPEKGSVGVPLWALENTSGSKWNPSSARKLAAQGGEQTIQVPNFAAESESKSSESNKGSNTASNNGNEKMKSAVIVCICLASVIAACFSMYLLRLFYKKRKERKMREFGDVAFHKVVPTKKSDSKDSENGRSTPMGLNLRKMVASLTIAMPKTPIFPKSPKTPGMAEKLPLTPLTARFWNFGRRDSRRVSRANENDESEYLAEKSVRFESMPGHDLRRQKALSQKRDSVASNYSDFDSYKSDSSHNTTSRPGSIASLTSSRSGKTLVTGSVKVDQPKLREAKRVDSIRPVTSSAEHAPVRRGSQASINSQKNSSGLLKSMPDGRVKSQSVKVSVWSDRASILSQEDRASKSTKSVRSAKESGPRSGSGSMSEAESGSVRDSTSARDSSIARDNRRTKSARSKGRLNSGMDSDYQGSLSDSDQRETILFPDEVTGKQRKTSVRFSEASSSRSLTMDKCAGRMQALSQTATEGLSDSNKTLLDEADVDVDGSEDSRRASGTTVSSESSNLRRLDSVIGQLEFDEMMSANGSPRKKSWFARLSTKSGRSVPPPSPAFSSAPGFAI